MPPASPSHRTRLTRRIAADPTSTALLLAGPTAFELWPGVRRVADVGGRVVVETELSAERTAAASVRALPPRRTPTSYVSRFEWAGPGLPETTAELVLAYAPGADGELGTHAALVLESTGFDPEVLDTTALTAMAEGFLANLARAAELRSTAA
ncbi:MAG: hypothetical protein JWO22_3120 [Frankiales bacterium]|nr:hypothetical protein [Frankiales bacterium]